MPTKKVIKRKVKRKKTTKAKLPSAKPIVIIKQKLPREKCCTDVTKSGEAYTVPIGFSDRLGTSSNASTTGTLGTFGSSNASFGSRLGAIIPEQKPTFRSISTETVPLEKKSIETQTYSFSDETLGSKKKKKNKQNIEFVIEEEPSLEQELVTESTEEKEVLPLEKRKYEKKKEGPRRNSMLDLEQRYTNITGFIYAGPTLKAKDFKDLVESLERKSTL